MPPSPRLLCLLRPLWVAVLSLVAGTAQAQSIGDWNGTYRAPPLAGASSAPPRIEPVPIVTPTPKAKRHQPPPARHPVKKPVIKASPPAPIPVVTPTPKVTPPPAPAPKPVASPAPPPPAPKPRPRPVVAAKPAPAPDLPQWPLGVAALLGGAAGWALWRRKSARVIPVDEPAPPPPVAEAPPPPPIPPEPEPELILHLTPTRFATTLTEAILRYDLILTNRTGQPLGPVIITGAIAPTSSGEPKAAPASLKPPAFRPAPGFSPHPHFTPDPMLAPAAPEPEPEPPLPMPTSGPLPELHRMMLLHRGESVRVQGQLRLPLAEITPIRLGAAALFVPVVRVQVEATGARDDALFETGLCMVVGQVTQTAGEDALGPFRLDAGPTVARDLAMRDMPLHAAV